MRDINRIEPFLEKLQELWRLNPDIRFGQLICWLESKLETNSFYAEEEEWLKFIDSELKK